ncbi:MAG: dihydroneopterin aldolase [Solirubrobacterales bacterium]|jgi:dihydroneopterin aldolase
MAASDESGAPVRVELRGISAYTHHGVTEAEREVGQRLEIDLVLEVADAPATRTDELAGTVDYAEVCDIAVQAATETSYQTLERLAQVIGERLVERLGATAATVRTSKPEPPLDHVTGAATVEVTVRAEPT